MDWLKRLSPLDAAAAANASDVPSVDAATDDGGGTRSIRSVAEMPAAPDGPDGNLSEEIKRRQVALLLDYVMAVRVR